MSPVREGLLAMGSIESNKEIVRRLFDAFADVDLDLMDELVSTDFVAHGLGPAFGADAQGWKDVA
jgi:ketosteroid isomerase-like protein